MYERIGEEGREVVEGLKRQAVHQNVRSLRNVLHEVKWRLKSITSAARRRLPQVALSDADKLALEIGRFRLGGEVHQWMYDRYSLARLLSGVGFNDTHLQDATSSLIPEWTSYHLDSTPEGHVIKPDLFFMEAVKPLARSR